MEDQTFPIQNLKFLETLPEIIDQTEEKDITPILNKSLNNLNRFKDLIDVYRNDRADIFAGTEAKLMTVIQRILDSIGKKTIENMNFKEKFKALKESISSVVLLYDTERLERNQSTENVSVIVASINDLKKREKEKSGSRRN